MSVRAEPQSIPPSIYGLLALLTLGWGINWPIMKIALTEIPVWTFRGLCVGAGALGLMLLAWAARQPLRVPAAHWPGLLVISIFNITGWNLFAVYGLGYLPSGRAAILAFTMPIWAVLLSLWLLNEKLTLRRVVGLALGMAGMGILIAGDLQGMAAAPVGALLMLGAAISWAFGVVLMKRFAIPLHTVALTAWQMVLGGLPIVVGALLLEWGAVQQVTFWPAFAVVYNMLVCFVFCYWVWTKLATILPVGVSGLSTLMIPVVGVFSGMVVLGEQPGWPEFVAMALVLGALASVLLPARA
jgi:drug/metabolite transporter (DMT)-like permease